MVGETAVDRVEDVVRLIRENLLRIEVGHAVGQVHGDVQVAVVALVFQEEGEIVAVDVHLMHLSPDGGGRTLAAAFDPCLNLSEASVQSYRQRVLPRHLHPVVLRRIVRRSDLHRGLESVVGRAEIDHRRGAQSDVIDIRPGIGQPLDQSVVDLLRGHPAVASDEDPVRGEQFRDEISHLVDGVPVEIDSIDTSNIICVKCSHIILF